MLRSLTLRRGGGLHDPSRRAFSSECKVGNAALGAVDRDVDRVGIGGDVGVDRRVALHPDFDAEQIVVILPTGGDACHPDSVVLMHGNGLGRRGVGGMVEEQ